MSHALNRVGIFLPFFLFFSQLNNYYYLLWSAVFLVLLSVPSL
jgi:hypothetical protein